MRNLKFIPPGESGFIQAVADAARDGARRFRLPTGEPIAQALTRALTAQFPDVAIEDLSAVTSATDQVPVTVLCDTDGERLTAALMQFVDVPNAAIIAPVSNHHWSRRSLFLISIPKAGTHLLTELVRAFGYQEGGECPATDPLAGAWHFLEFTNSHTTAADFFIDSVRRAPHGNRFHPFPAHPALFIYRNPLDIVVSEASYYHRDGATAFTGYLRTLDDEERLLRLIDDKPLLGSIRDRVFKFSAWLDFCNVTPISYEELVGPRGEGSASTQEDLVWSLMLKLHVPGNPADFAKQAYNPKSQTFSTGKIGSHRRRFTPAAWAKFQTLSNDFMEIFGYAHAPPGWSMAAIPRHRISSPHSRIQSL